MVLVHHQVAHGEVGAGADALAHAGLFAPFCAAVAAGGYLGIRQHRQARRGVLKARGEPSRHDQALAARGQGREFARRARFYPLPVEKAGHDGRPPRVAGEHQHGEARRQVVAHVFRRLLGAAAVAGQLLGEYVRYALRLRRVAPGGEGVRHIEPARGQLPEGPVGRQAEVLRARVQPPGLDERVYVLAQLLGVAARSLGEPHRLVEQYHRALRYVVERGVHPAVDERRVAVRRAELGAVLQQLRVLAQRARIERRRGRLAAGHALQLPLELGGQGGRAAAHEGRQRLRRGQDLRAVRVLRPPLADGVEKGHGVYLVAPELHAHGLALRGRKKVQYAAAPGKLPRGVHLSRARIAAPEQRVLRVLYRQLPLRGYLKGRASQVFRRYRPLQQSGGGDDRHLRTREQGPQRADAPLLPLAGDGVRRVEGEVARIEVVHLRTRKGGDVRADGLGGALVRAEHHQRRALPRGQGRGQLRPPRRRQARYERGKPSPLPGAGEGGGLRYVEKCFQ